MGQVTIAIPSETVTALHESGSVLYVLKAVGSSNAAGRPLVWYSLSTILGKTVVQWPPAVSVYVAPPLAGRGPITPGDVTGIAPGQVWMLGSSGNALFDGGPPADVSIQNETTTAYSGGMSQAAGADARPLCVFPLGRGLLPMTPLDRVVMFFSTDPFPLGTVFVHPWTPKSMDAALSASRISLASVTYAIDVNVAGSPEGNRNVQFSDGVWTWDGGTWATELPPTADFLSVLIRK